MSKRRLTALSFLLSTLLLTSLSHAQTHLVKRVIDGDTIQLSNSEQVRLIGVDTPETKHPRKPVEYFGKEASAFTKKMVEGKMVRLEYEKKARENKRGLWGDPPTEKDKKLILKKYVGSKDSKIYHHPTCIAAQNIKPSNRRVFDSVKKAVDAGYVPCKICRPPYSK
jgi:micrococcal nuclease